MISLDSLRLNRCDWFLILFVFYHLSGILYSSGGPISILILGIIIFISLLYAIRIAQMSSTPIYFRGLNVLIILFTIYGVGLIATNPTTIYYPISGAHVTSYNYLKYAYMSLLPIYPFYYYAKQRYLTTEKLKIWGFIFLISLTLSYFHIQQVTLEKVREMGSSAEDVTNNAGYLFLSFIPVLIIYKKKPLLQFALLAFTLAFIVMGMKRGAILVGVVISIYFMQQAIKNSSGKYRFLFILLSFFLCVGTVSFFIYMMNNSAFMMQRINDTMEGNTSSRDKLYSFFWNYFIHDADILQFFIGRGANGTMEIYKNYAHNDWLELAVNQGLLGIVCYFFYWLFFYKTCKYATDDMSKVIIVMTFIIYIAKTWFSMSYGDMSYISTCILGYALATMYAPEYDEDE